MNPHDTPKTSLDGILESIRNDEPSRAELDGASARVAAKLGLDVVTAAAHAEPGPINSCAGFQALIPDFLAGRLAPETALLLEDHSRECIPCRRALISARQPKLAPVAPVAPRRSTMRWFAAAAAAAVVILGSYAAWQAIPLLGADPQLKVMRVDGSLVQLRQGEVVPLRVGMTVSAKEVVRTTRGSGALVMMDDGSRIEMRDRTELSVGKRRDGQTVRLGGGAIIVEASPQGAGHLDVRTDDCLVAVKGTIFSVNHGTRGSRVSVVEGAVRVAADGRESLLAPGDQVTTSDSLSGVSVQDEIAWSKDADRYVQLLHELASLRKDLDARVPTPGLRYDSRLLDRVPDGTVLYAAIPNLTASLVEAKKVFEEHVAQSPVLQAWWNEHMSNEKSQQEMNEAFDRIQQYGSQLGEEIVLTLTMDSSGHVHGPTISAEVKDTAALKKMIIKDVKAQPNARELARNVSLTFDGNFMKLAPADAANATAAPGSWTGSTLHAKLEDAYSAGATWLFAADLKTILGPAIAQAQSLGNPHSDAERMEKMGILDAQYVIASRVEGADGATQRAEIVFDQPRRGVVGWLADPAPLGAAEFISPDAAFAAAAIMKRPEIAFADALSWIGPHGTEICPGAADDSGAEGEGQALEAVRDLAGSLGGDVAIGLDGPIAPVPSFKLAVEVNDTARFQAAFQRLIAMANERIAAAGQEGRIVVEQAPAGNRIDWVVRFTGQEDGGTPMRYTFVDGYFLAAPSQVLLDQAIEQRRNGYTLTRSKAFTDLLPKDGEVDVSAAVWEHLGPSLGPLAEKLSGVVNAGQARELAAMAGEARPHLVTAYAEDDRIVVASRGESGLGSILGSIISAENLGVIGRAFGELHRQGAAPVQ